MKQGWSKGILILVLTVPTIAEENPMKELDNATYQLLGNLVEQES